MTKVFECNTYHISPNKRTWGYAKHRKEAFILHPIFKTKSLSKFGILFVLEIINPFPDVKNLTMSKLKAFADEKIKIK